MRGSALLLFIVAWLLLDPARAASCAVRITGVHAVQTAHENPQAMPKPPADGWQPVTLPDVWTMRWPGYSGVAWYRVQWQRGCPGDAAPLALRLDGISMAGQVWLNDDLLWQDVHLVEPLSRSWNLPRYTLLPASSLRDGVNTLWVRVVGVAAQSPGLGALEVGDPAALQAQHELRWWRQRTLFAINLMVAATLGCLGFCVWLMRRGERAFGWYALMSLAWVLLIAQVLTTETWPFPDSLSAARAGATALTLYVAFFCLFTWRFGGQQRPRLERALWWLTALLAAAVWLVPVPWLTHALLLAMLANTVCFMANCVQFQFHALRVRQADVTLLALCLLVFAAAGAHDFLAMLRLLGDAHAWTPYTAPLATACLSLILGWRIARSTQRIERFNAELTQSIAQARADLSATLAREHALTLGKTRLQERLDLSRELHDGLGGSLVSAIAQVEHDGVRLGRTQFLSMLKLLRDDLRQLVDTGSAGGAQVPPTPQDWLAPVQRRYGNLFDELGIGNHWQYPSQWRGAPSALQCLALTRVLQEALTNVVKHSHARCVQVQLTQPEPGQCHLRVQDDGVGFDVQSVEQGGLGVGLGSMKARLARVGGTVTIHSQPGETVLVARLG
ncbi:sensor histidine kinase [Ottowia testudinis]|uniref:Histidine kinase n=1 Tax=Ottowia testudinis TaxID=2816950 RepID=A0A975CCK6_9BURK|nr:ATP-binding protein [Ottowia testudinis]QTD43973.1 histidine kinase [Ottowia testudinis]